MATSTVGQPRTATRVVVIGGGFAGVAVAQTLERRAPRGLVDLQLVSRDNFALFHPMLPEVAGGGIEAHHILSPLRQLCPRTVVTVGVVQEVDLDRRVITVAHGPHEQQTEVPYDLLVLAVGAVTNFSEVTGMAQHAFALKTIGDALYLRNHVVNMLEEADVETDPERRRELLTFVVAGGGFSGVETVAEMNDFVVAASRYYSRVDPRDIQVVLLHAGERILPELSEDLAAFALRQLERRGVEVRLKTLLDGATENDCLLRGGTSIPSRTLVCTIGTANNPLIGKLACAKDDRGRLLVTPELEVADRPGVWALGDCTAVPNQATGKLAPPTAQFAQREGHLVAENILAHLAGKPKKSFSYPGAGQLVSLGHRSAVAEVFRTKISGFPAWWIWRTVYLGKLPGLARKTRVALDWTLDLLFGRDIVQMPLARAERVGRAHFEPGDEIIQQGEIGDLFYVIADGEVEVIREGGDGSESVITRLVEGEFFGEMALLQGKQRRNATVRAITAVNVVTLGRDDFTVLAREWSGLKEIIVANVQERGGSLAP